jgi:hypothetical protein
MRPGQASPQVTGAVTEREKAEPAVGMPDSAATRDAGGRSGAWEAASNANQAVVHGGGTSRQGGPSEDSIEATREGVGRE